MTSSRSSHNHSRSGQNSPITRCGKCCYYCRQVATFLFSHIGLCTLLLGYALVGAFTFQAIESRHEQEQRMDMIQARNSMILELSNMTNHSQILHRESWIQNATEILAKFEKKFLHAVKYKGYDGSDELSKTTSQWSFSGALLYSIIVITTIGYGNVAPRTDIGKIVTILYAIIGIPLMLFCLSKIGHAMAHSFKFIYWKCCCFLCVKPKKIQRRQRRRRRMIRQQRQRAMMVLSQQPSSTPLNNNGEIPLITPTSMLENHQLHRTFSNRSNHFSLFDSFKNNGQIVESPSSSSTQQTTPANTPSGDVANSSTVFFNSNNSNISTNEKRPKKSNLSRSHSARTYQEGAIVSFGTQTSNSGVENATTTTITNTSSNGTTGSTHEPTKTERVSMSAIICNKYASLSDEYIDAYRARFIADQIANAQNQQQLSNSIRLRLPPRRTPSQVRFVQQERPNLTVSSPSPDNEQIPPPSYLSGTEQSNQLDNDEALPSPPPPSSQTLPPFQSNYYHEPEEVLSSIYELEQNRFSGKHIPSYQYGPLNKSDIDSDLDSDSSDDDITEKNIPITVCLTLVVGYICGGALFFSTSEEWSFLDASYFCFVTLSTIGFGDLVPGRTVLATTPEEGQMTLAICALYLLFGMALLAMSLNLVKEKVLEMVRIIGERIGILVNDDDDYY